MRDIGKRGTFSVVDDRPDEELPRPANDNYLAMKLFEAGSILEPRDYDPAAEDLKHFGLLFALCVGALGVFVLTLSGI
ncbi:hypothetical protein [Bradyrhizobium sp. McL0616]|uniref:hypothetical protein n=1 Tax=Bradyrhizobium sp. McL0616 TaxID=3415674 RepID=UPI003CEDE9DF